MSHPEFNEKFSGKGHAAHVCKARAKKPPDQRDEEIALNRICRVYRYMNLSRDNLRMLENYSLSSRERLRLAVLSALASFTECFLSDDTVSST